MRIPKLSINIQKIANIFTELRGTLSLISPIDLAIILALPCIATLLMFVPSNIHDLLVLQMKNPSWWQYFTSNFVHTNFTHYSNNLIAYFLFVIPQLLVLTKINEKRNYLYLIIILALTFFLVTYLSPIVSPGYFQKEQTSQGLSGIEAGIFAFTLFILVLFASKKIGKDLLKDGVLLIFILYPAFLLAVIYLPYYQNILYPCIIFAFMIGCIYFDKNEIHEILKQIQSEKTDNPANYLFLTILVLLFFASPLLIFPPNPAVNGSFVDILTHYFGYIYGGVCFICYYRIVPALRAHLKI